MSTWDDTELAECSCPKCSSEEVYQRNCEGCGGDGENEVYDDDPMWYEPGDTEICETCSGKGIERWCSKCGYDLSANREKLKIEFWPDQFDQYDAA